MDGCDPRTAVAFVDGYGLRGHGLVRGSWTMAKGNEARAVQLCKTRRRLKPIFSTLAPVPVCQPLSPRQRPSFNHVQAPCV